MLIKIVRERWYYYIFIMFFIVIILFSVLQAHSYLIITAENDLDEEIALFVSEVSNEYNRFESEMIYNSSIGSFESILNNEILDNKITEKIRRVYSMNIDLIDKISVYDNEKRREFVIEESNYFKVSPLVYSQSIPLSKIKTFVDTGDKYKLVIPVYNEGGNLESNVSFDINIDSFLHVELKRFYLGESSWAWYYDSFNGLMILDEDRLDEDSKLKMTNLEYVMSRLKQGYKGKLRNELTLETEKSVISSFYPIKLGVREIAIGFSVSQFTILGQINRVIAIIVFSFVVMIILIVLLFLKLINDEVKMKVELKKSNETLDKILKEIPTTIIIHKKDLSIIYINDFGRKQLAIENEVSYDNLLMSKNFTNFTIENRDDINYTIDINNNSVSVLKTTVPIEYYGSNMYLTAIVDISAIEEARKLAEESNRMKSEFIANVSHEIRTPMNGIIASAEILEGMDGTIEQKDYIAIIEQSANQLMIIINDILDLSKIESGKLIIEDIHFRTRETIESVYDQFIIKANQKKIEIINDINVNVPDDLIGDPNRLKQVLTNLIGNAVKFTSSGFVYIGVDLEKVNGAYAKLLFTIADTGVGIDKEALAGIFEPFIQADGSITRNYGGTGLGTTISKKIINEMGGNISVDSPNTLFKSSARGTVFTFDITFKLGNSKNKGESEVNAYSGMSALVIEDNSINIKIIERMLTIWGVESITTRNMAEALEISQSRKENFDVLITDMILEDVFCDEVILKLETKKLLPDYVVIVSSDTNYDRVSALRNKGFDIILKPIRQSSLFNVFKLYSDNLKSRRELLFRAADNIEGTVNYKTLTEDMTRIDSEMSLNSKISPLDVSITDSIKVNVDSKEDYNIKGKILVAEDNAINMKIILKYLSKFNIQVISVSNGQEAVESLEKNNVDLVFMDLQMPIMNGIDATKLIREKNKELSIIAMTANAMEVHKKAIYEAGMNDFLSKPLKFNDIKSMLIKHLIT